MTVEDGADFVLHQEVVHRHVPAGAMGREAIGGAVCVQAAPFVEARHLDAPACGHVGRDTVRQGGRATDDVVREDKLVFGAAVFQRVAQPVVLRLAERPVPGVISLGWVGGGVPERIQDDEERISPLPGIVVLQQAERAAGVGHRRRIPAEEGIGHGRGEVGLACQQIPGGNVVQLVGGGAEEVAVFRLMIPEGEEIGDAVAEEFELIAQEDGAVVQQALVQLAGGELATPDGRDAVGKGLLHLVGHEDVAEVDVEVGAVGGDVGHRTIQQALVGVHIQMRIG